ncbi:phosphotransferase family protein [Streptomyces sp. A1499]|uniref:phosphotransferase family protein n=1 Tax=Streptomyces sp. A1499 TaxID=2563104 RepID=UPI00109ED592|nr:phosphotransferase family protein [Streptomyces sp. A1499]THC43104.1 phosphotransferase family protein [Streptomyces sp. A1499]
MSTAKTPTARADLAKSAAARLSEAWNTPVVVSELDRLSGGASMETWTAKIDGDCPATRAIIRRDRPGTPLSSRHDEAALLRIVYAAGVPVPRVLAQSAPDETPAYLIMEFLDGETIPRKLLRDAEFRHAREVVVEQIGRTLAAIHTVAAESVAFLGPARNSAEAVAELDTWLARLDIGSPVLELAVRWLAANTPPAGPTCLVHGDVRTGNLLVAPDGLVAVLDWELAHVGTPAEDLGWFCTRAWQFGANAKPAGGFGTREELLAAYTAAGGTPITRQDLHFWEVFGTFMWALTCVTQSRLHLSGQVRSVELAAIGRRLAEAEYDLVVLLQEGP